MITLSAAQKQNRLSEFIEQEESRGISSVERAEFDAAIAALVKAPQSKDQTSRSPLPGGSSGKRTRQGNGRRTSR
jgi:hypothetical protein